MNPTPSQTVGPYFAVMLPWARSEELGSALWLRGTLYDGRSEPVPDGILEVWDAASGGFGRCRTTAGGEYAFRFDMPGPIGAQAPHLAMSVFARGLLDRVVTRVYFPDEPGNATDPVLSAIPDTAVRESLVARKDDDGYRFDIHLQGPHETAFFELV
ncbi:protocatechuate 3,4-dioxygenase subunit alpha [Dactylosporangium sucinum]|uniref:Protocatechuate 3,4-dioxygenase subunit alpha n=1 Tax=Dactylosporangium sucinum TaxID=1424081 RepID=A0A917WLE3_9ACTN|nr:protocatechuate 3,4-dioxygenase subunit alpha [Dactylosporangium sucinum]GGM12833.1 protocatechuate 3,4-dioxygenase subunit alpha [Dactylosporangium sucinum]